MGGGSAVLASLLTSVLHCVKLSIDWQDVHEFGKQKEHDEARMWIKLV